MTEDTEKPTDFTIEHVFPTAWPSENGGWAVIAYQVKAMFQTASSA